MFRERRAGEQESRSAGGGVSSYKPSQRGGAERESRARFGHYAQGFAAGSPVNRRPARSWSRVYPRVGNPRLKVTSEVLGRVTGRL